MKESKPQLMTTTDVAAACGNGRPDQASERIEPFGSFVALKRLNKLDVEAVRMQGCADNLATLHDQPACRKLTPSIGARHGLTCHVLLRDGAQANMRCLRINDDGGLTECAYVVGLPMCSSRGFLIGVRFEQFQWRYRTSWVYQCIYLDLGHVVSSIRLLAQREGCDVRVSHCPALSNGDFQELVWEPVLLIELVFPKEQHHA